MSIFFKQNLVYLRQHQKGATQDQVAADVGIKKSTLWTYEAGRSEPKYRDLVRLADYYGVSVDDLLLRDLSRADEAASPSAAAPIGSGKKTFQTITAPDSFRVLVTAVDSNDQEQVVHIPLKASAGYAKGYGDPEFINRLETFNLPFLPQDRTYRSYEIEGDSMLPLKEGTIVFVEFVEDWRSLKDGTLCLVTTANDGLLFKKIFNYLRDQECLLLVSTNERYKPRIVPAEEVREVWRAIGYYSTQFPQV
ncbi:hypothetical protein GCM10023189_34320 [Nibrella saemangeumensis]|uniref:HTH cro/C1-type domain-containing protein n=1 Tax=Nibrella saemangeumensis TaxID=1084526 RepID=A0ABP8N5G3_9BACT